MTNRSGAVDKILTRLKELTPDKREALLLVLKERGVDLVKERLVLPRRSGLDRVPLALPQERLWFFDRLQPGSSLYNMPFLLDLEGELRLQPLERALQAIVRRHEILRTRFTTEGGEPVQVILPSLGVGIRLVDVGAVEEENREGLWRHLARVEALQPFNLDQPPLLRVLLIRFGERRAIAAFTLHHIVADGWSVAVLVRELMAFYQAEASGQAPQAAELPFQYADYALWQRSWLEGEVRGELLAFWRRELADSPPALRLPTDRPKPGVPRYRGNYKNFAVSEEVRQRLEALCRQEGATLFMLLLASLNVLLFRFSRQRDLPIGTGLANRQQVGAESLIGFFVNTVVIRTRLAGDPSFRRLLQQVRSTSLAAFEHQDLPFDVLVEELQPERDPGLSSPIVQAVFVHLNTPVEQLRLPGLTVDSHEPISVTTKFDLVLTTFEQSRGLQGRLEYNTDLYDESTASGLIEHFKVLLEGLGQEPDRAISALPLLTQEERRQILGPWNAAATAVAAGTWVHHLISARAAERPEAVAVVCEGNELTYGDLDRRSNQLAQHLATLGAGPESRVGLYFQRGCEMIVGMLAALKAGAAYTPFDPSTPRERLTSLLAAAAAELVLSETGLSSDVEAHGRSVICLDAGDPLVEFQPEEDPQVAVDGAHLAYLLYTSGSTGRPKGVGVSHASLLSYLTAVDARLGFEPGCRYALVSTFAADLGLTMILPALCSGGTLHVVTRERAASPDDLGSYLRDQEIDYVKIVPSHLGALMRTARQPQDLMPRKALILGGEASGSQWVRKLRELAPGLAIFNHYGPTESTVGVSTFPFDPQEPDCRRETLPLGSPLGNARIYVCEPGLQLAPVGAVGEIWIGGAGLARGYLDQPAQTAERFVPNPFGSRPGERLYRSGDLGRFLPTGNLEFLGRADRQMKIRGYRVELPEIEAALARHELVAAAAVRAWQQNGQERRLVAYAVPDQRQFPGLIRQLRQDRLVDGRAAYRLPNGLLTIHLNKNETDYLFDEIFVRQAYMKHGIEVRDGDVVLDVGANIGFFMLFLHTTCRNLRIFSVEPSPRIYEILRTNAELHGVHGGQVHCAVSNRPGRRTFTFYPHFSIMSGLYADLAEEKHYVKSYMENLERGGLSQMATLLSESDRLLEGRLLTETFEVDLKTVSEILAEHDLEVVDLLKINVEKAEREVLEGIRDQDWPKIRQVVAEVHDVEGRKDAMVANLAQRGFQVVAEQDPLLSGTDLFYVYARRPEARERRRVVERSEVPGELEGPAALELDQEQVASWERLFDQVYGSSSAGEEEVFDLTGWVSSYSGQPIPADEMKLWRDSTVERILGLEAERVLEIGCGTGGILFQVAPHCREYWATEISRRALDAVEGRLSALEGQATVQLLHQVAGDFQGLEERSFDAVILNSVIQYFPQLSYLHRVLLGSIDRLRPGGALFIGDVRSLPLAEAFFASVEVARAPADTGLEELQRRAEQSFAGERELLVDPAFFTRLQREHPRIDRVEIQLKRGRSRNELTAFRYDVVLHLAGEGEDGQRHPAGEVPWKGWGPEVGSLPELRELLAASKPAALGVLGITNARVTAALETAHWLAAGEGPETAGEIRRRLAAETSQGIDPEELWELGESLGYAVDVTWGKDGGGRTFDVLFRDPERFAQVDAELGLPSLRPAADLRPWPSYANDPLKERLAGTLVEELRSSLKELLPEYMVPSELLLLDRLPTSANGKLDYDALPAPAAAEAAPGEPAAEAPADGGELEAAIAQAWREVLGVTKVGYDDNFFDLGGHSLLIVDVLTRLVDQGMCSSDLSVVDMFQYPTVRAMAEFIRGRQEGPAVVEVEDRAAKRQAALARRAAMGG